MESMRDGEVYWVTTHGIPGSMPSFHGSLDDEQRWQLVQYVRELRRIQRLDEKRRLGPYEWDLPPGFPYPRVPEDNPMTAAKVELGRHLFYDKRLSANQTQSCASCHKQERAFTDGKARGEGSTGEIHPRGPMSIVNVAYNPVLTWANPNVRKLSDQALVPLFGEDPVELGMSGQEAKLAARLKAEPRYGPLFSEAFPGDADPYSVGNLTRAIASFERIIISGDAPYDRFRRGDDPNAISASAKRGEALFFSEELECFHCHGGVNFSSTVDYFDKAFPEIEFHNTGLYNLPGELSYPKQNAGLFLFTEDPHDVGKFKPPTLRNIALTAPYMHDGSIATLAEVIEHYAAGGRTIAHGERAGVGADNPNKSEFVKSFQLTEQQKADLIAFLEALTDTTVLTDPRFSDPW
ncbi:MAG: di-heme enzyme [Acidobacteria bacterium]|nr:di-heme enzyme [Acidobacteriota bacterium]